MLSKINNAEILLNAQYIKDLSFENPNSPEIYTYKDQNPSVDVSVNINANKMQNELFELALNINITSKVAEKTIFIIELIYAGLFTIKNVTDELVKKNLFIECPNFIYPFARSIITNLIVSAGFPPIMLDMIDFEKMYNSNDK